MIFYIYIYTYIYTYIYNYIIMTIQGVLVIASPQFVSKGWVPNGTYLSEWWLDTKNMDLNHQYTCWVCIQMGDVPHMASWEKTTINIHKPRGTLSWVETMATKRLFSPFGTLEADLQVNSRGFPRLINLRVSKRIIWFWFWKYPLVI